MNKLQELREQRQALLDEADAIVSLAEETEKDLTADETARLDAIQGKGEKPGLVAALDEEIDRWAKVEARQKAAAAARAAENGRIAPQGERVEGEVNMAAVRIPAKARSRSAIRSFVGDHAEKEAYIAGLFYQAAMFGNANASEKLDGIGIQMAQTTGDNTKGGYLVPELLESTIIRNVENYGIARQKCQVMPVGGGSISIPRLVGEYTAYFVGENEEGTESDATFDQVKLTPEKIMVLSRWSTELPEDAVVQLGDMVTRMISRAFANKEDSCLFLGDGTSTYGGMLGLANALAAGSTVNAASGINTPAEVTQAVFEEAIGKLPEIEGIMPEWYCHKSFWANTMMRLSSAAGGNSVSDIEGGRRKSFLGYPVNFVNAMTKVSPTTDLASQFACYFGDMELTAAFGDKRGVTIATDSSVYFTSDAVALKGTERFDINVHERGDASNAGTMIGIKLTT